MQQVKVSVSTITIPTYPSPASESLPMFAENRVHQRTSGRPYPNKVVLEVDRSHKQDQQYKLVTLENEYVKIEILPEIGGRIYSAYDKRTGYDYFYKQHVIKPALIGVLGSWVSGGVEFNWPFHHRASGFMPCDFTVEQLPDGGAACHLSEHDPIDRMKGMVSIILRPHQTALETKMRLYNRTDTERSFLWWENAAVPVNEDYQIFFPSDVSYVNFHYLKSRTTYPIAGNGVFNGIPMDTERDISWHKNTREATSYFACASQYDFFGGYDHGKRCGVVHIGDHHISPGKKMFTWAYGQLATSWENALTDTDGQYAELMAGSYSDNQPNFAWLAPYETKEFSQHWYPISEIGSSTFANLCCAFRLDRETGTFKLQTTRIYPSATITITHNDTTCFQTECALSPDNVFQTTLSDLPEGVSVVVTADGKEVARYTEQTPDKFVMPEVISDMPSAAAMNDAQQLYLAGVHVQQYRDPHTNPDSYWKQALQRKPDHIQSLVAMAKYELDRYCLDSAEDYITKALRALTLYNERTQSGEAYYTYARILEAKGDIDKAYDYYYKAYWAADSVAKAMTRIALLDLYRKDPEQAVRHATNALQYGSNNNLARSALAIALRETGKAEEADRLLADQLAKDPLDHMARFLQGAPDLYDIMDSDAAQTCLDIAFDLAAMGKYESIVSLLEGLTAYPCGQKQMLLYTLGYYKFMIGKDGSADYAAAEQAELGEAYPFRYPELKILEHVISTTDSRTAKMLLGCLTYNKLQYTRAAALWEQCEDYISRRNLAVAYFSHLDRPQDALAIMKELVAARPEDAELLYETVCLMDKMGVDPQQKIALITAHTVSRDDILTELSKAYNQAFMPDKALEVLLSHNFVPCEGGEHAIADQYMFAYLLKGKQALQSDNIQQALDFFIEGQTLPQSLGAGIWNHCKLIPLKFHQALCLERLGQKQQAHEIFRYIATTEIEYFSNMHLKELPYFQALSWDHLGEKLKGEHLMTKYRREWSGIKDVKDNGYFSTTPFFISFVDAPEKLRLAQHLYLNGLCDAYMGQLTAARQKLTESVALNNENMLAVFFAAHI